MSIMKHTWQMLSQQNWLCKSHLQYCRWCSIFSTTSMLGHLYKMLSQQAMLFHHISVSHTHRVASGSIFSTVNCITLYNRCTWVEQISINSTRSIFRQTHVTHRRKYICVCNGVECPQIQSNVPLSLRTVVKPILTILWCQHALFQHTWTVL